jgi:TonB family protein
MNQMLNGGIAVLVLAVASFAQLTRNNTSHESSRPLLQVMQLMGDWRDGLRQSCLLVYADGRYRRETRRQKQKYGRASFEWESPKVYEDRIGTDDLRRLKEVIESENFRAVRGTLGQAAAVRSRLVYRPSAFGGGVTAHDAFDIFEASVAHSTGGQMFAVIAAPTRPITKSVEPFIAWVNAVEKRKSRQLDKASANGCAISAPPAATARWSLTTSLTPRAIDTPFPDYPVDRANMGRAAKVMLQIVVNADGSVGSASIKRGIDPVLDALAIDAVTRWKFEPAQLVGMPIPMIMDVEVSFHGS